jgi:hypothetical protein
MPNAQWKVYPHEPVDKHSENLWSVQGSLPNMSLRRVMAVARLADGRLAIHSAVALDETSMRELEAWGTPAFLLVPNRFHRFDAPAYKKRFPQIRVLAPKAWRHKVAERVSVDGTFEDDFPPDPNVRIEPLAGLQGHELALSVRSSDGVSLVFTDAIFNMDMPRDFFGRLITAIGNSSPGPRVSRIFKFFAVADKQAFRADLERLAATPDLVRVVVAHSKVARGAEAAAALRTAASYV